MLRTEIDTWKRLKHEFPESGGPDEKLRFLLHYATLAPSSHNSQPWLFWIREGIADIYADRSRALPVVDPEDRQLVMSCGAALMFLRVAMLRFGVSPVVSLMPDPDNPDHLARVRCGVAHEPTCEERQLFRAMRKRRTVRARFDERDVPPEVVSALEYAATREGAWIEMIAGPRRDRVVDLVMEADEVQGSDPSFRRELAAWLHPNRSRTRDGMPGFALGWSEAMSYVGPLVVRTFDWGERRAARDRELALGSPLLAVLGTPDDGLTAWLRAGQALARVLLKAAAHGVSASFLNQPLEVTALRLRLKELVWQDGSPQLVLRMGYGPEAAATPRRGLEDVLVP